MCEVPEFMGYIFLSIGFFRFVSRPLVQRTADDFAAKVRPVIEAMLCQGKSLRAVVGELDRLGVNVASEGKWTGQR